MFYVLLGVAGIWLFATGAILFSINAFSVGLDETSAVANGAIYMSAFALVLVLNVAVIFPGLLLLQPIRLLKVLRAEKAAITPRQRFRGMFALLCFTIINFTMLNPYPTQPYTLAPTIRHMRLVVLCLQSSSLRPLLSSSRCLHLLFCCYFS